MSPEERDPQFLIAERLPRKMRGLRVQRQKGPRRPPGLPHQRAVRPRLLRPRVQPSAARCSPTKCCGPNCRAWTSSWTAWTTSSPRRSASPRCISTTAASQQACPPLQALLHIMLHDEWEGKGLDHPEVRKLFTRESCWRATGMRRGWRRNRRLTGSLAAARGIRGQISQTRQPRRRSRATRHRRPVGPREEDPGAGRIAGLSGNPAGTLGAEPIETYL